MRITQLRLIDGSTIQRSSRHPVHQLAASRTTYSCLETTKVATSIRQGNVWTIAAPCDPCRTFCNTRQPVGAASSPVHETCCHTYWRQCSSQTEFRFNSLAALPQTRPVIEFAGVCPTLHSSTLQHFEITCQSKPVLGNRAASAAILPRCSKLSLNALTSSHSTAEGPAPIFQPGGTSLRWWKRATLAAAGVLSAAVAAVAGDAVFWRGSWAEAVAGGKLTRCALSLAAAPGRSRDLAPSPVRRS